MNHSGNARAGKKSVKGQTDVHHVRFKPVLEEYEDRYLSSNDEGSEIIRPSSLGPKRSRSHDSDSDEIREEEVVLNRPLSVKTAVPFSSPNKNSTPEHEAEDHEDRRTLRQEGKSSTARPSVAPKRVSLLSLPSVVSSQKTGSNPPPRRTSTLQPQTSIPPAPMTEEELLKRTRLKTIFDSKEGEQNQSDNEEQEHSEGIDHQHLASHNEAEDEQEVIYDEANEEKYNCFDLFEVAERIKSGQMMKIKTGVAGTLPVQDSFPMFKSARQYLVIYWSILIPQDDWSLVFFDELIDENYFAVNYFQQQTTADNQGMSSPIDRPSLLKLAKKIIPMSEISEVFLDQKSTTSFRFYRGQEVTNCTPIATVEGFTAATWADAIYAVLQLYNFHDDELLQRYYHEYFLIIHPNEFTANPETTTEEEGETEDDQRGKRGGERLSEEYQDDVNPQRLSFNSELYRATKGLRRRGQSEDSTGNRSNSPSSPRPSDDHSKSSSMFPFFGKKKDPSTRKASIFGFASSPTKPNSPTSPPSPTSGSTPRNKRGSIIQVMKNMFSPSKPVPKDDAPLKLFEPIEEEKSSGNDPHLKSPGTKITPKNLQSPGSPSSPSKAARRWTMFAQDPGIVKRNKGMETSIPLATLMAQEKEALRSFQSPTFTPPVKKADSKKSYTPTTPPPTAGRRASLQDSMRSPQNHKERRAPSLSISEDDRPSMETLTQSLLSLQTMDKNKDQQRTGKDFRPPPFTKSYSEGAVLHNNSSRRNPTSSSQSNSHDQYSDNEQNHSRSRSPFEEKADEMHNHHRTHADEQITEEKEDHESNHEEIQSSEAITAPKNTRPKTPAEQLGRVTILDHLYQQSQLPHNRPSIPHPLLMKDGNSDSLDDNLYLSTIHQRQSHEEYQKMKAFQELHQELIGIKIQKQQSSTSSGKSSNVHPYLLEKEVFPERKKKEGSSPVPMSIDEKLAARKRQGMTNESQSPVRSPSPSTNTKRTISPTRGSDASSIINFKEKIPWHLLQGEQKDQKEVVAKQKVMDPRNPNHRSSVASTTSTIKTIETSARPKSQAYQNHLTSPKSGTNPMNSQTRDERILQFLQGRTNYLVPPAESDHTTTNSTIDPVTTTIPEKQPSPKAKSSSIITIPDTFFSFGGFGSSQSRSNDNTAWKDSIESHYPSSDNNNNPRNNSSNLENKSKGSPKSPSSAKRPVSTVHNSNTATATSGIKSPTAIPFKNAYAKGMVSDSEGSVRQAPTAAPAGGARKALTPTSNILEKPFENDHSKLIERERERQAKRNSGNGSINIVNTSTSKLDELFPTSDEEVAETKTSQTIEDLKNKEVEQADPDQTDQFITTIPFTNKRSSISGTSADEVRFSSAPTPPFPLGVKYAPPPQSRKRNPTAITTQSSASITNDNSISSNINSNSNNVASHERDISPVKGRTSLRRIFGSMVSVPFDSGNNNTNNITKDENSLKKIIPSQERRRSAPALISNNLSTGATTPTANATGNSAAVEGRRANYLISNAPPSAPSSLPFPILSPSLPPSIPVPSLLTVKYYKPLPSPPSTEVVPTSITSLYYKYEITLAVISKFELQTKLLTSNQLVSHRIGLQRRPSPQRNKGVTSRREETMSVIASNIIVAELLESDYYLQFHRKYHHTITSNNKKDHRTRHPNTSPDKIYGEEYVFIPIQDVVAIDFDAKLSGLFRFTIHTTHPQYPIVYAASSSSSNLHPTSVMTPETIFSEFRDIPVATSSSKGVTLPPLEAECLFKAMNVVELQVWLQFFMSIFQLQQQQQGGIMTVPSSSSTSAQNIPNSSTDDVANMRGSQPPSVSESNRSQSSQRKSNEASNQRYLAMSPPGPILKRYTIAGSNSSHHPPENPNTSQTTATLSKEEFRRKHSAIL